MRIRNLFYTKQGKLLSIWRFFRLLLVYGPVIHGFLYLLSKLFNVTIPSEYDVLTVVVAVILTTLFLDKEKIESLGIELRTRSLILFAGGILWAYFCCVQVELVGALTLGSEFQLENPFTKSTIRSLVYYLFIIALSEELLCRSYVISNVGRDINVLIGLVASAIVFILIHYIQGAWANISVWHAVGVGLITTLLFGLTFIMTKNIFIVIGFHGAWDAFYRSFKLNEFGVLMILFVLLVNTVVFYLILRRRLKYDIRTLINSWG